MAWRERITASLSLTTETGIEETREKEIQELMQTSVMNITTSSQNKRGQAWRLCGLLERVVVTAGTR